MKVAEPLVVPPGVVTVTVLMPVLAFFPMARFAVSEAPLVDTAILLAVMPPPLIPMLVPLGVKLVPARVTATVVPRVPELDVIEVSVGTGGGTTLNGMALVFVPPSRSTLILLALRVLAFGAMVRVAETVLEFSTLKLLAATVTPPPEIVKPVAPVRFGPVRTTETLVPWTPLLGVIAVSDGNTVNCTAPLALVFPSNVAKLTVRTVCAALGATVKIAVTVVSFTT